MARLFSPLIAAFSRVVPTPRTTTYSNPVMPGDFPDPSVIRVGERDFYATTTSTDWAPQFPIMHSRDLVSWTLVGAVFEERPAWTSGSFWAPEISEFAGRYYVYYVARKAGGPLCIAVASAAHPAGPYTDHGPLVGQNDGSIDPMATVDENGARWLVWKEDGNSAGRPTPIWAQRLSDDGLRLFGEIHELLRNDAPWEDHVVEAPVVFRRAGWFYMLYSGNACCGEACAYAVGAARARSLAGPWEKCPANPIVRGNAAFRCPGHGSVVSDAGGQMYFLYHAYAATTDAISIGRQILLDRIDWTADEWPFVNSGRGPSRFARTPFAVAPVAAAPTFYDDFTTGSLSRGWQWPQGARPAVTFDRRRGGFAVLRAGDGSSARDPLAATIARPLMHGDYIATAALDVRSLTPDAVASLTAYGDRRNALGVGVRNGKVVMWRKKRGKLTVVATGELGETATVHVRWSVTGGTRYRASFSRDGRTWTALGDKIDGAYLPPWDRGVRIALSVGGADGAQARFDFLRIRSLRQRAKRDMSPSASAGLPRTA